MIGDTSKSKVLTRMLCGTRWQSEVGETLTFDGEGQVVLRYKSRVSYGVSRRSPASWSVSWTQSMSEGDVDRVTDYDILSLDWESEESEKYAHGRARLTVRWSTCYDDEIEEGRLEYFEVFDNEPEVEQLNNGNFAPRTLIRVRRLLTYSGSIEWVQTTLKRSGVPLNGHRLVGNFESISSVLGRPRVLSLKQLALEDLEEQRQLLLSSTEKAR